MNILVPTDFSEIANNALNYAAMLATNLKGEIILLHVIPPNSIWWSSSNAEFIEDARKKQASIKERLVSQGMDAANIETYVISEFPLPRYINDFASGHHIDFVVMGTKGSSGLAKTKLGSFTLGMIENVHIPVIAVPPEAKATTIKHILYPTDLGNVLEETRKILPLAKAFNASIHIVHIPPEPVSEELLAYHSLMDIGRLTGYEHITTGVAHSHNVRDVIDQQLIAKNADMLVMFAQEKGFFEKLFKGSKTEQMSSHTQVPLLVFRKTGTSS